jgi:hypothetical protein
MINVQPLHDQDDAAGALVVEPAAKDMVDDGLMRSVSTIHPHVCAAPTMDTASPVLGPLAASPLFACGRAIVGQWRRPWRNFYSELRQSRTPFVIDFDM